jgi:hypothetical protein
MSNLALLAAISGNCSPAPLPPGVRLALGAIALLFAIVLAAAVDENAPATEGASR